MTSANPELTVPPPGPASEPEAGSGQWPRRITPLGIVAVALCLGLLAGLALWPLAPGDTELESAANLEAAFAMDGTPLGWELVSARKLRGGKEVYVYEDPSAEPPAPLPEDPPAEPRANFGGSGKGGRGDFDKKRWSRLAEGAAGQAPRRVALVRIPAGSAEDELRALFTGLEFRDLERVGKDGGEIPTEGGRFPWGAYEAPFLRIRHLYEHDGKPTFHETVRVNLTVGRVGWAAILKWDPRAPADVEWAKRVASLLAPASPLE